VGLWSDFPAGLRPDKPLVVLYNVNNNSPCLAASIIKVILSSVECFSEVNAKGLAARKHRMDLILPFMTAFLKLATITAYPNLRVKSKAE